MNKTIVKKNLQNLVAEAAISGEKVTKKAQKTSDKQNKSYYKDVEKKMSEYDGDLKKEGEDAIEEKKFPAEGKDKEYHDDMEIMNGQEMIEYDREPSESFKERAKNAIEGDSTMGNETYTGKDNGNTEPVWGASDAEFGKKLVDRATKSKEKRDDAITPTTSMGDDIEIDTRKGERVQPKKIATEGMKRLRFKKDFNGVGNALKLIPESFRVDGKVFEMTDNKESYKIKWDAGKAIVLEADSPKLVSEDFSKIKHLMGYKAETTLGTLDGKARVDENEVMRASVNVLTENVKDYDGDGEIESSEDEYKGSKDKAIKKAMAMDESKDCRCDKCDCVMTEAEYAKSHVCESCSA